MTKNLNIFVVVVTYNGMRNNWIKDCLYSLGKSSYPVNTIVVDNNTSDNTCNFVCQSFPNVTLFQQNKKVHLLKKNSPL